MVETMLLFSALQVHFPDWNRARLICLAQLVYAITIVKTINLAQVATAFQGSAKESSNYKRAIRFMKYFTVPLSSVAKFVVSIFPLEVAWYIAIDRTNWKLGSKDINIFMLSICHGGIAIPLLWESLNKRANTKTEHRIAIMERFIKLFGVGRIKSLLADREFIGKAWLKYLIETSIPFTIRVKCNHKVPNAKGKLRPVKNFFRHLRIGETLNLGKRKVMGVEVYIVGRRLAGDEWHIIITNDSPMGGMARYSKRQEIETMFGCLKTRGFNFESTHITKTDRLDNLIAVMVIAFVWAYRAGELFNEVEPIKIKSHGDRAKSIFRHGYDYMRRLILNSAKRAEEFIKIIDVIISGSSPHTALKAEMGA